MKRIILAVILLCLFALPCYAATKTICASGCDYTSLTAALGGTVSQSAGTVIEARATSPGGTITFSETLTWSTNAQGSSGSPVTLQCRTGDVCIIEGGGTRQLGIDIRDRSWLVIQGLYITNQDSANSMCILMGGTGGNVIVQDFTCDGNNTAGSQYGILNNSDSFVNVTIRRGTIKKYTHGDTAIGVGLRITSSNAASTITLEDLTLGGSETDRNNLNLYIANSNNTTFHISRVNADYANDYGTSANVWISNTAFGAGSYIDDLRATYAQTTNNVTLNGVSNLTINRLKSYGSITLGDDSGFGVAIFSSLAETQDIIINDSTVYDNGNDGWNVSQSTNPLHDITFNRCSSYNNGTATDANKGDGWTVHGSAYNISLNYCVAYDNKLSAVAMVDASSGNINNMTAVGNGTNNTRASYFFSMTGPNAITSKNWTVKNSIGYHGTPYEVFVTTTHSEINEFSNNQYFSAPTATYFALVNTTATTWAQWTATHDTVGSKYADPLFRSATDFRLKAGSPAINAGVNICTGENAPLTGCTGAGTGTYTDYAGKTVPRGTAPEIGAYEFYPKAGGGFGIGFGTGF